MKKSQNKNAEAAAEPQKNKTVKVRQKLHYDCRVQCVKLDMPLQSFIEQLLQYGLDNKVYQHFGRKAAA